MGCPPGHGKPGSKAGQQSVLPTQRARAFIGHRSLLRPMAPSPPPCDIYAAGSTRPVGRRPSCRVVAVNFTAMSLRHKATTVPGHRKLSEQPSREV